MVSAYIVVHVYFTTSSIPDMTGKTVIVTGANSGIGRAAASALAAHGAHVVLAVRNNEQGRRCRRRDARLHRGPPPGPGQPRLRQGVRRRLGRRIDILINNAGIMVPPLSRTADGFEMQFGTNHLGHFALTNLLLPQITGRVVTVASGAHRMGTIDFADLNWERKSYRAWRAYGQSKLANLLFTAELQRRLADAGSTVEANAAHPGYAATNLQSHSENRVMELMMAIGNRVIAQDDQGGALPTLYAAVTDIPGNSYAGPGGFMEGRGAPKLVGRSGAAQDMDVARRLWDVSEQLTGVSFPLTAQPATTRA